MIPSAEAWQGLIFVDKSNAWILWFDQLGIEDVGLVGGKNASLGEMYRLLTPKGVPIPNGFAVTATAYRHFLETTGTQQRVADILSDLDTRDLSNLQERGRRCRDAILAAEFPQSLKDAIIEGYRNMCLSLIHI